MRHLACVLLLATALGVGATEARAQVEVPQGSIGFLGQLSQNTGEAGDAYQFAWLVGVSASYEIGRAKDFGFGAAWSLAGGQYLGAAEGLADERVRVLEMSLGLRVRRLLGKTTPRFFVASTGLTILRLDRAVPPDNDRLYLGPYGSIGLDQYLGASTMLSFAVRLGLVGTGPSSLGVRIGISWGS